MTSEVGKITKGPWIVATSCSWRRIVNESMEPVCIPVVQRSDNHPDLHFPNGGPDGADARAMIAAPALLEALEGLYSVLVPDDECRIFTADTAGKVAAAKQAMALARGEGE